MIDFILNFFSNYLIEFMGTLLCLGLVFRWLAYRQSRADSAYYSGFTREMEMAIDYDREKDVVIDNIEVYITDLLGRVARTLPSRSLRFGAKKEDGHKKELVSLRDFVKSKQGLISSIQAESSVFNCKTPPNFGELTHRVLDQDVHWTRLVGAIPIDGVTRMIDILPNLFIVFGVLGTFIGISMALPEIANIDFNNLEGSQKTLTSFVLNVTFAMKTSIAGIVFSLVLTFLNTAFPIKDTRGKVFKKVETCFQMMWYHVQKDQTSAMSTRQVTIEILNHLKVVAEHLKGKEEEKKAV